MTFRLLRKLLLALLGVAAVATLSLAAGLAVEPAKPPPCPPAPPATQAWTLAELIPQVLCRDPRTRQSWSQIQARRAGVEADAAGAWPQLALRAGVGRNTGSSADLPGSSASLGVDLSWLLYDGGQRSAGAQALQQALAEAAASHDHAVQSVVHDAVQAHLELRDETEHLRLQQELKARFDAIRLELRRRKAPESDQLEVRWSLTQADIERHDAAKALALAQGRLALLLGRPPDQAPQVTAEADDGLATASNAVTELQLREWMALAQRQHPEILAAQARAAAAQASRLQAERGGQPNIELTATRGRSRYSRWPAESTREAGVQLTLPLFDAGGSQAQARAAQAEHDGAEAALEEVRRRIAQGVWDAYQEVLRAGAVRRDTQHAVAIARRLLQETQLHVNDPDAEFTDLLDAQEREVKARLERQRARSAWEMAHWRLALAVGRLQAGAPWPTGPLQPAPERLRADPLQTRDAKPAASIAITPPPAPILVPARPTTAPESGRCRVGDVGQGGGWCVPR